MAAKGASLRLSVALLNRERVNQASTTGMPRRLADLSRMASGQLSTRRPRGLLTHRKRVQHHLTVVILILIRPSAYQSDRVARDHS